MTAAAVETRPSIRRRARPPARLGPRGLALVIATGAAAVLATWWENTSRIDGAGGVLTHAGRLTGLLGGYAVLVVLLLMARVPAIERGIGTDRLTRWHGFGGRYAISLLSAHALFIIWGYAETYDNSLAGQTETLLLSYPYVLMATVAFGLFVGVGLVSARAARRHLRYETWYYLHFYTYLAVALSLPHEFENGAELLGSQVAVVLWGGMYAVVGALLLWYRVVTPVGRGLRHRLRVVEVRPEARGVVSITMSGRHLGDLRAEPGQFFRFRFLTRDGWWQSHPFSLSAPPEPRRLRITVKASGDHTTELQHLHPGVRVLASGPFGAFTPALRTRRKVLLIAGGVGIAPLYPMLATMPADAGDLTLVYRASSRKDVALKDEIDLAARERGARVHFLVGRRNGPVDPFVGRRLPRLVPGLRDHDVFVCGPPGFTAAVTEALHANGVAGSQIHSEQFAF